MFCFVDTDIFSLCSTSQLIHLDPKGVKSSVTLSLNPGQNNLPAKQCKIQIKAPDTHFIYVRLVDWDQEKEVLVQQQHQDESDLQEREFEGEERVQAGRKVHSKRNGANLHSCNLHVVSFFFEGFFGGFFEGFF